MPPQKFSKHCTVITLINIVPMCQALCYCFVNVNTFNLEMKGQRERGLLGTEWLFRFWFHWSAPSF